MPAPLSLDLRRRIADAIEAGEESHPLIAERFQVSVPTVERISRRVRDGCSLEPGKAPGPRPKMDDKHRAWIADELSANPFLSSYELAARFRKRFRKLKVHRSTILRAMHDVGFSFKKRQLTRHNETVPMS